MINLMPIRALDVRSASEGEYRALNEFENRLQAEELPDDPPVPLEEAVQRWQHIPAFVEVFHWAIWQPESNTIIAVASAELLQLDTNQHMMECHIAVLPEFRRQGIARALLVPLVELAQRAERRLLIGFTNERVPAGAAFLERLGARRGLATHINQLVLAELDRELLRRWQDAHPLGFALGRWTGAYPEEQLEAIVQLHEVMNAQPRDQLEMEDFHLTPAHLRQIEQAMAARGTERWTLYVTDQATGQLAGYTEVYWHANRPHILYQGDTGVFPDYRNRGLGRWLKAAMLETVLQERPQVQVVRTGNADSNAPMLKINRELGFKPYLAHCIWQVETQQAAAYLAGQGGIAQTPAQP